MSQVLVSGDVGGEPTMGEDPTSMGWRGTWRSTRVEKFVENDLFDDIRLKFEERGELVLPLKNIQEHLD